jgi:chromosome segregation ATPase
MSKFIKRLGTKKHQFSFDITVHYIQVTINVPVRIGVVWKRSKLYVDKKRIETKNKYALSPSIGNTDINETLTMVNTLYQEKTGVYQKKNAVLTVQALIEGRGTKKIGDVLVNLSEFVSKTMEKELFSITDCGDKKARVCLSVKSSLLGDVPDNLSETSGNSGSSIGTEGEYSGSLFRDQDLSDFSEENKTKLPPSKKPPFPRKNSSENEETARYKDIKAACSALEKENQQLKIEKEDLKLQLNRITQESKKERELYYEYSNKLDSEITSLKAANTILLEKLNKQKKKSLKYHENCEKLIQDLENLEKNYTYPEKLKLINQIKALKSNLNEATEKIIELNSNIEIISNEKEIIENSKLQLESLNIKFFDKISILKAQMAEIQGEFVNKSLVSQPSHKKKIEEIVAQLKNELKTAEDERDEALSKQTELLSEIQRVKTAWTRSEEDLKKKIRELECRIEDNLEEAAYLRETTEESADPSLKNPSDPYKLSRNRSETDPNALETLKKTVIKYQDEIINLKTIIEQKNQLPKDLSCQNSVHIDETMIQEPVFDEGPDKDLKAKLSNLRLLYKTETSSYKDKIQQLENSLSKAKDSQKSLESQVSKLKIENVCIKEKLDSKPSGTDPVIIQEESFKQIIQMKKIENKELKQLVLKLQEDLKDSEKKYMNAKVANANFEMEKESIFNKYRDAQEVIRDYANNYKAIENEFYKVNERFGQVLNENNYMENEIQVLKSQIFDLIHKKKRKVLL